ncbi:MAG: hypothetical protein IK990_09380 [Ruminiclostridium sp.]|nr:hypothetical protein [Ruminiclostridium sp.]
MKVLSVIMKIVETGIVCIWGVAVGIFFPVCIMAAGAEIVPADIAARTDIMVVWLVTAGLYILAAAMVLGKHYRIAAGLAAAGLAGVLTVNGMFGSLYAHMTDNQGPRELYLPLIFATLLDIFILAVEERKNIARLFETKKAAKEEIAPSILADDPDEKHS